MCQLTRKSKAGTNSSSSSFSNGHSDIADEYQTELSFIGKTRRRFNRSCRIYDGTVVTGVRYADFTSLRGDNNQDAVMWVK